MDAIHTDSTPNGQPHEAAPLDPTPTPTDTPTPRLLANLVEIRRALDLLCAPGDLHELRVLHVPAPTLTQPKREITRFGYFTDREQFAAAAAAEDAPGIYFTLNPCNPDLLKRADHRVRQAGKCTKDEDIIRRGWLLIDADPQRERGSATDTEKAAAEAVALAVRAWLTASGFSPPVFADSGNGFHLLYRLDLENTTEIRDLVKRFLENLAGRFSTPDVTIDKGVHNASRICKLYGTVARKGPDTPDRPHRRSRLIDTPDPITVVPRELLESVAGQPPPTAPAPAPVVSAPARRTSSKRGERSRAAVKDALILRALEKAPTEGRNEGGLWLGCQLRDEKFSPEEAFAGMLEYRDRCDQSGDPYTKEAVRATHAQVFGRAPRPPASDLADSLPYEMTADGIFWLKPGDGADRAPVWVPLTTFTARIVADITEDDGVETRRTFDLEGTCGGTVQRFSIPAAQFNALNWATEHLGSRAAIYPGPMKRDQARFAIQRLSHAEKRTCYTHTGWRRVKDQWVFLHSGGALGADGVETRLPSGLSRYLLPPVPDVEQSREALRRSLHFLTIAPPAMTWPLLAAIYLAPLASSISTDFALWIHGDTGGRKSTMAALALSHFGNFDRNHAPASFSSTGNALEMLASAAKDLPLLIDDFAPASDPRTAAAQEATCNRILRSLGDGNGRGRLNSESRYREPRPPRCLVIATAELHPPGTQSAQARTLLVPWEPGAVDLPALTRAQSEDHGCYPQAMASYLFWLAPQLGTFATELPQWIRTQQPQLPAAHGRVQESGAKLFLGAELLIRHARILGALSAEEAAAHRRDAWEAIKGIVALSNTEERDRKPSALFLEYLFAMLAQGAAHLADRKNDGPPNPHPEEWGWERTDWGFRPRSGSEMVGWVDTEQHLLLLQPVAVHRAVTRYAQGVNLRFPVSQRLLGEALRRDGLLRRTEGVGRNAIMLRVNTGTKRVWEMLHESPAPPVED